MSEIDLIYPNQNWDDIKDPETFQDIYKIRGKKKYDLSLFDGKKPDIRVLPFCLEERYNSYQEAEKQVEVCRNWEGGVESIEIFNTKPYLACCRWDAKRLRELILSGKKVFPLKR